MKNQSTFGDTRKKSTLADKNIDMASINMPVRTNHVADVWKREQMRKIKQRYEKLTNKILDWETKKKKKAKRHLEHIEAQLDKRKAKTKQSFYNDIERIEHIAGGAKAQAQHNQEKQEHKLKKKANKITSTGKMPTTCFCF